MSRFEIKIVAALLLIAIIPLVASVILVGQVIRVSESVAEGQTRRLVEPLARAGEVYRALFDERRQAFRLQSQLIARDPALVAALSAADRRALDQRLAELVRTESGLGQIELLDARGAKVAGVKHPSGIDAARHRTLRLEAPVAEHNTLRMTFYTPRKPFDDYQALGHAQRTALQLTGIRADLATYYRVVFLIMFGAVLLVATAIGLAIARRTARQVAVLARATREVAEGDLQTQVRVKGRDELGELAMAFNEMVRQLRENRERISYLEKIGAWQEIARRLAHEIKNPLTPIQLAVQQLHQKYQGEDSKFRRLLDDACDIVTEEIQGLRRLVQAFSAFARLPNVQPEPLELNALIDDFFKSHAELVQRARTVGWEHIDPPARVIVDRMLIKHVLYNLIENAVEAAEDLDRADELEVTLSARRDQRPGRLTLTVADNGPGMSPDILARIFEPYFTTKGAGTGLGLPIVKKIVLEHRGSIAVWSEPGEGTRFTLVLPMEVEARHESALRTTLSRLLGREGSTPEVKR
jgi:nitrogen fixation/metabolism regulation signal transduction histidine kinase